MFRELSGVIKMVHISLGKWMWVYAFVNTHSAVHLRFISFTEHELFLIYKREKDSRPLNQKAHLSHLVLDVLHLELLPPSFVFDKCVRH